MEEKIEAAVTPPQPQPKKSQNLSAQLVSLKKLQELDLKVRVQELAMEAIPKEIARLELDLSERRRLLAEKLEAAGQAELVRRDKEGKLRQDEDNIKRWEVRLREIRNPREFQALQKEIFLSRRDDSILEEEILKQMDLLEQLKKETDGLEAEFQAEGKKVETQVTELKARLAEATAAFRQGQEAREELMAGVDESLMARYERIRVKREGQALAEVKNAICRGCNMNIPFQLYSEVLRAREIVNCPSCQRILYAEKG